MPDKANTAIPEDLGEAWATAYGNIIAQIDTRWSSRFVKDLIERIAALTVRAEQAEATIARLSTPVSNEEWIKANYQQGIATGIPKDQEGKESVMTWRQFTTRKDIDALIASRLATPEPPKEAQ